MDNTTPSDPNATSTNPPDWIRLARDAYTASTSFFDASIRQGIEQDLRQFQGHHPAGSKYLADPNKGRSKLFRPKTRATIRKNEAAAAEAFFSTNDVVAISSEDDDDPTQQASAAVMAELLQYRLTKSIPWFMTLVGAYQDAQTVGVVASYQYWEYNETKKIDRPAVRLVPIENLRFDPGANWTDPVGTSPYIIELIPMYVSAVKSRMRTMDSKTGEPKWKSYPEAQILSATKTYGDTIRMQREGARLDSKAQVQANNNYNIVWVHKNIVEVDDVDYVYYTLGSEYMLSDPVPLQQAYFHGKRPYVIGSCVIETHKTYPSSVARLTKDVQAEINEVANSRIDNVKLAMNKRYFARRNKQVDIRSVTRNVPGSVTLMNDTDDVKVIEFNDVTASSYKEQEMLNLDFDDVAGAFSQSSVQSNRKLNETVGGMKMLDSNANQVSGYQLRTFVETWVEPVLRQIVLLEQYYETDEVLIGLCGKSAQLMQKFGIDAVTDDMLMNEFTLNVNVGMGATSPTEQVKQFIQGMQALQQILQDGALMSLGLNTEEVIKELFGKLGYKDGGRFFDLDKQQDPQLQQAQQMIQQLQQQLQSKQMDPQLLAATVAKMNAETASMAVKDKVQAAQAVKTGAEAQFSAMQTAEVIAAVPAVAPIADTLMQAAGYVTPNPAGVNPNFPQPGTPANGLATEAVKNKRTGVDFMPGTPGLPPQSTTLNPTPPVRPAVPATPGMGERHGIETTRPDSAIAKAAYADGGLIGSDAAYGLNNEQYNSLYQNAVAQAQDPRQPHQREQELPTADAATILAKHGGNFINSDPTDEDYGQPDNLNSYNLAPLGLAPNALNSSPVHDVMQGSMINSDMMEQGPLHSLFSESAFNNNQGYANGGVVQRYAQGGVVQGPGTGTSDSVAAVANGQPLAVSKGEFVVPAAVVQTLGQDFFEKLLEQFHTETNQANGAMPTSNDPIGLQNGDYIIPSDVVKALGKDFFQELVKRYGGAQ